MALTIGTSLGPYDIVAPLGAGGMGEVYRARDTRLNRDVAIKVLLPAVANDADRLARFSREAQLLASLNHPNIAHIHGLEDVGGSRALVMELVEGPTLADRIAQGPVPVSEALPIARQIADALEAAHEQGIVHRDLKPANIKVRDDGTVKVLDFGLAKAMDSSSSSSVQATLSPTLSIHATQAGIILGTAAYMAPEQAKGRPVDKRVDIWAFGLVLYEMLAGRRGYEAEDVSETLAAVLTREVDWNALPDTAVPRLRALVRECLVRDPKQRLRDIGDARRVLDQVMSGVEVDAGVMRAPVAPSPPAWRRALPWAIAGAAVVIAAALAWALLRTPPAKPRAVTRAKFEVKEVAGFLDVSRDGTKLAYTVSGPKGFHLALRQMDQFEGRPLQGSDGGQFPIFSPDGDWIAFTVTDVRPMTLKKVPIGGGTSITLCPGGFLAGGAWGADDTIVFSGPKGLLRVPANGGSPQALTTVDSAKGETAHTRPQFLTGGRSLLFTVVSTSPESPQFAVLDLQKGGYRTVAKGGDNGRYAPTGHLTFVRDGTLFAVPFDLTRFTVTGSEAPLVEGVSVLGPQGSGDYAFSETGTLVYWEALGGNGTLIAWADRKGVVEAVPAQVPRMWGNGRLSPDGLRMANSIHEKENSDIWVLDLARGTSSRLTFGGQNENPAWTPDGLRVVYSAKNKDGKTGVYSVPADGSGQPQLVIATETPVTPTSFTPDGKTLLYTTQPSSDRPVRVMVVPPAVAGSTREPHPLRDGNSGERHAQISPDGKWVAFTSNETGTPEVYVLPFPGPGPKVRVSTQGGIVPRWAHDGRELFYWTPTAGNATLMAVAITPGSGLAAAAPRELFTFAQGTTWDVAPDGQRFLVETPRLTGVGSTFATVTDWFEELRRRAPAKKF